MRLKAPVCLEEPGDVVLAINRLLPQEQRGHGLGPVGGCRLEICNRKSKKDQPGPHQARFNYLHYSGTITELTVVVHIANAINWCTNTGSVTMILSLCGNKNTLVKSNKPSVVSFNDIRKRQEALDNFLATNLSLSLSRWPILKMTLFGSN